ncbi:P-II family nitrogen regulator [Lentibacillus sp. L22]|uniref:P-II family nitrogen regulator n=1 Tax=Lentibacillus TaxID=175304 RepID=UPI0022B11F07|nr:P-II family nitrogen regulator [Lentibacillus daqui]
MAMTQPGQKLIITIVRKEKAKKVIQASKNAGANGGTVLIGEGIRLNEKKRILGIPVERERELILTLVSNQRFPNVMNAIIDSVKLNKPRQGIGFVIDTKQVAGISHMVGWDADDETMDKEGVTIAMEEQKILYDLVVTIVNKGDAEKVVDATRKAGAEGGTILCGRGTGVHEQAKLFNILIEPEKEVVLTLINREKTDQVVETIEKDAGINKPGKGISFVLAVEKTVGINHILNEMIGKRLRE